VSEIERFNSKEMEARWKEQTTAAAVTGSSADILQHQDSSAQVVQTGAAAARHQKSSFAKAMLVGEDSSDEKGGD